MPRRDPLDATLEQLARVRNDPRSPEALALLRKILAGRSSHAAAKAAEIAGESEIEALVPDLVAGFQRFLDKPVKSDPGCAAKVAIADALYRIGAAEIDLYLRGIHHVQLEPQWGAPADTAVDLRGTCALALIRVHYPDYLSEIAELLADREPAARRGAVQALIYSENPAALPLLRLKALVGDEDEQVVSDCLLALLKISGVEAMDFVGRFLNNPSESVVEAALLALGGSRLPQAFPILKEFSEGPISAALSRSALLAIAMLKQDDAIDYLLALIADTPPIQAREAIRALAVYRHDDSLRERVDALVQRRREKPLSAFFAEVFDSR